MAPASNRERLYEIFADPDDEPRRKIQRALEIGTEHLQLPIGFHTRVEDGTQEIVVSTGEHPQIQSGESCPLEEAYCRRTVQLDSALAIQDAHSSSVIPETAVEAFDLGTYVGAKVTVNDEPYGTICFADDDVREPEFTDSETYFVELFARLVGQTIERHQYERELEDQQEQLRTRNQHISVLNRVLRHNLRNDMNVIRGLGTMLQDQLDGQEADYATRIVETSDELIRISDTARELESSLNASSETHPTDIVSYIMRVADEIDDAYPEASICVDMPEKAVARVVPPLETALRELVENAVKHGGKSPSVSISVADTSESVTVRIRDNGPGLPEQERQVLLAGEETPLIHGSGLGLWLAHSIIQSIDATLEAEEIDSGTCIKIALQKNA